MWILVVSIFSLKGQFWVLITLKLLVNMGKKQKKSNETSNIGVFKNVHTTEKTIE